MMAYSFNTSSMVGDSSKRSEFIKWSTDQIDK